MATSKHIDRICMVAVLLSILLTLFFVNGHSFGIQTMDTGLGYENRLFDPSVVHTIDIAMDNWDSFLETCENEEYSICSAIIDGEAYSNVGLRAKGNTSLSTVSSLGSDRYSFKIEFDQYNVGGNYHGLDKLCLNNIIQDTTYMKDYLTYQMMDAFGADAPLSSFAYISVNGEDWGLYLAVEGVEDSFLQRNYGSDYGDLYKPDSTGFGGGRGNGRDFDIENFRVEDSEEGNTSTSKASEEPVTDTTPPSNAAVSPDTPERGQGDRGQFPSPGNSGTSSSPEDGDGQLAAPPSQPNTSLGEENSDTNGGVGHGEGKVSPAGGDFNFGGGSSDVKLQYIDDNPDSYSNIFNNAKTDVTKADQQRLIASLKTLNEYENLESVLDMDEVLRYFVVHNFVVNGDSYTGNMIHNYYLYEENGRLSMIPWDYNLAYGSFMGNDASSSVNDPIDEVLDDRPMQAWIFSDESYTTRYHELFREFLDTVDAQSIIENTVELIAPYVDKDPTKFYTSGEFESGAAALKTFCLLRAESVRGQLAGTIPSTSEGQREHSASLLDIGDLNISDMGSMNNGAGGGHQNGGGGGFEKRSSPPSETTQPDDVSQSVPIDEQSPQQAPPSEGSETNAAEDGSSPPSEPAGDGLPSDNTQPGDDSFMQDGHFNNRSPDAGMGMEMGFSDFPNTGNARRQILLLGTSCLTLIFGCLIAWKYKRRN